MPIEGANSISELDPANPASDAPAGEGDDHLRQLKEVLLASFPALDGLITNSNGDGSTGNKNPPDAATFSQLFTKADAANAQKVPLNGIIMYSGAEADIPAGWFVCNGQNGTPDLRDRFVLAADYDSQVYQPGVFGGNNWDTTSLAFPTLKTSNSPDPTFTVDAGATTNANGNTHGHWYVPPFYALAFIQYKGT